MKGRRPLTNEQFVTRKAAAGSACETQSHKCLKVPYLHNIRDLYTMVHIWIWQLLLSGWFGSHSIPMETSRMRKKIIFYWLVVLASGIVSETFCPKFRLSGWEKIRPNSIAREIKRLKMQELD